MNDSEIIKRVLSGETEAYEHLVREHQNKVLGLCLGLLSDPVLAEDAAQEVFIKAYESLGRFRGESSFSTWIYRIAFHHCQDILRKRSRRPTESLDQLIECHGDGMERLLSKPDDSSVRQDSSDMIEKVLSALPPDYRTILVLREVQGLSYQEISEAMDCSLDSVKARLRRARSELEQKLRHFLGP